MRLNWKIMALAAAAAGSTIVVPADLAAQGRSQQNRPEQKVERKTDRRVDRDDVQRQQRRDGIVPIAQNRKGNGPPFCRSGEGHPVHGRSWCVSKGYGMGNDSWGRAGTWGDVIFGRDDRDRRDRDRNRSVSGGTLSDILGSVIFGRLQNQATALGGGPLSGRWLTSASGPVVLQVQAGSRPLAEFVDANRDGRTDAVYLNLGNQIQRSK